MAGRLKDILQFFEFPMKCPVCGSKRAIRLLNLSCGNLDNSLIYRTSRVVECRKCGHIYNLLSRSEINGLDRYYEAESAPGNLGTIENVSDRPGSSSILALQRYGKLYRFMSPFLRRDARILDAGRASGGYLDYLRKKGFRRIYGLDMSKKYISEARNKNRYLVKAGKVESMPFASGSMDVIVMDQVMEHLVNPRQAIEEARRVLVKGGLLCLSVPDASRYRQNRFFDFFWFLVREHVQHFDAAHLKLLAESEGFQSIAQVKYETPMMSRKMILPVLNVIFRSIGRDSRLKIKKNYFLLGKQTKAYIAADSKNFSEKRKVVDTLIKSRKPVYVWGIGREFMYLYESTDLKRGNLAGLIDVSPQKQKKYSVDGRKITGSSVLRRAPAGSVLLVTAAAHAGKIEKSARASGYRGQIVKII